MRNPDEFTCNGKILTEILMLHKNWRNSNGGERANLCGIDFRGADLSGVDLSEADLCKCNFRGADLRGVDFSGADLSGADLCKCNFRGADLRGADLCKANLCEADLREADLREADLCGSYLCGADLRGAFYYGVKIKTAAFIDNRYRYKTVALIAEDGTEYIGLGCNFQKASEWGSDGFWNNIREFNNNRSAKTRRRQSALMAANEWLDANRKPNRKLSKAEIFAAVFLITYIIYMIVSTPQ